MPVSTAVKAAPNFDDRREEGRGNEAWLVGRDRAAIVARRRGLGHLRRNSESLLPRRLANDHPAVGYGCGPGAAHQPRTSTYRR